MEKLIEELLTGTPELKFYTHTNLEIASQEPAEDPFDQSLNLFVNSQITLPKPSQLPFFTFMFLGALSTAHETEPIFDWLKIDRMFLRYDHLENQIKVFYAILSQTSINLLTISLKPDNGADRNVEKMRFDAMELKYVADKLNLEMATLELHSIDWRVVWCTDNLGEPPTGIRFIFEQIEDKHTVDHLSKIVRERTVDALLDKPVEPEDLFETFEKSEPSKLASDWPVQTDTDFLRRYCEKTFSSYRQRLQKLLDKFQQPGIKQTAETTAGFITGAVAFNQFRISQLNLKVTSFDHSVAIVINSLGSRTYHVDQIPVLLSIVDNDQLGWMIDEALWRQEKSFPVPRAIPTTSKRSIIATVNFDTEHPGDEVRNFRICAINQGFVHQLCQNFDLIVANPESVLPRHFLDQEIDLVQLFLAGETSELMGKLIHGQIVSNRQRFVKKYVFEHANLAIAENIDTFLFEKNNDWIILNVIKDPKKDHAQFFENGNDPRFTDCLLRKAVKVVQINLAFDLTKSCYFKIESIDRESINQARGNFRMIDFDIDLIGQFDTRDFSWISDKLSDHLKFFPQTFSSNLILKTFVRGILFEFVEEDFRFGKFRSIFRVTRFFENENGVSRSQNFVIFTKNANAFMLDQEKLLHQGLDQESDEFQNLVHGSDGVLKITYRHFPKSHEKRFEIGFKPIVMSNSELEFLDPVAGPSCSKRSRFSKQKRSPVMQEFICFVNEEDLEKFTVEKTDNGKPVIEIDAEKLSVFLQSHSVLENQYMIRYLSQQKFKVTETIDSRNPVKKLLNSAKTLQRLESAGKIAHFLSSAIILKHMAIDVAHGNFLAAIFTALLVKGDFIVTKALDGVTKILPSKYGTFSNFVSKSLKRSNFFGRLASVYNFYLLIRDSVSYYETGRTETLVAAGTDAAFLLVDLSALFFAGSELMVFLGPIGAAIVALVFIGNEIYQAHKITQVASEKVGLNWKERLYEDTVAFFTGEISDELNKTMVEHDANTRLSAEKLQIMAKHPEINRYIFPAVVIRNGRMVYHQDNKIILNQKVPSSWTKSKPKISDTNCKLFCFTRDAFIQSINPGAFAATFDLFRNLGYKSNDVYRNEKQDAELCHGSIGIQRRKPVGNGITVVETGDGLDKVIANAEENTYFIIGSGFKKLQGGTKRNWFSFVGTSVRGFINGSSVGFNSVILSNYQSNGKLEIGAHEKSLIITGASTTTRIRFENIHEIFGRKNKTDKITVSCLQKFIDAQNGDAHEPDLVYVPFRLCRYNITVVLNQRAKVVNYALHGDFIYEIRSVNPLQLEIELKRHSETRNLFLMKFLNFADMENIQLIDDYSLKLKQFQRSIGFTVSNFSKNTFLGFADGFVVKPYLNLYLVAFKIIDNDIDPISLIDYYRKLSDRLCLFIVIQSSNFSMVFSGKNATIRKKINVTDDENVIPSILSNDPNQMSYLIANDRGSIFRIYPSTNPQYTRTVFISLPSNPKSESVLDLSEVATKSLVPIYINIDKMDRNIQIELVNLIDNQYKVANIIQILNCSTNSCLKNFHIIFGKIIYALKILNERRIEIKPLDELKKNRQLSIGKSINYALIDSRDVKAASDFVTIDKNSCNYRLIKEKLDLFFICNEAAPNRQLYIVFKSYFTNPRKLKLKFKNAMLIIEKKQALKASSVLWNTMQIERQQWNLMEKFSKNN